MQKLTDYTSYADALRHFSKPALWALFDGDRDRLNIAHECVDRHPSDAMAVRITHEEDGYEDITFGDLALWSNRVANFLVRQGVVPGDRVAIMLDPSLAFYAVLFGAMKAGAVAVPLFTLFGPDGLAMRVEDCTPKVLFLAPHKADLGAGLTGLKSFVADDGLLARIADESAAFQVDSRADDMAMYQYTSGTTRDLPEAVKHRHRAIVTVTIAALYGTGVRPGDRFMCPSSPAWGHGLWHGTLAPLALGVTIASYAGRFRAERLLQALVDLRISNLSAAATHYRMMKNAGVGDRQFALEKLSFTGEPIDSDTASWVERTFGQAPCSMYGTTEIGAIIFDYPGASDHAVRPGALGKPAPGQEIAILDDDSKPCAADQVGNIMVRRGDGWYHTKDRGHTDEDGYFYHDGRADDVIISAGWTISAIQIENILLKHADVAETAVIAVADDERGQVVKAFVVSGRSGTQAFTAELQAFTKDRLSQHEYPRIIAYVAELPKTPAGKVNRKALRDRELQVENQ
jgi:acetyl-CoA synthetase